MSGRILKKSVAVMLLITLLLTDFLVLGMSAVSYAIELISTTIDNSNVNFTAYFKDEEGRKVVELEKPTNTEEVSLYLDVTVSKEGYFNGEINLGEANFTLKEVVENQVVNPVEGNKITLDKITGGESKQIELKVKPIIANSIDTGLLDKVSKINISGTYTDGTQKKEKIEVQREVNLVLTNSSEEIEYATNIVTNKTFKIGDENKKVVQMQIDSKLKDNNYPVKESKITIDVPENVQDIKVISRGTKATNGKESYEFSESDYIYKEQEHKLEISIENNEENGIINWMQNAKDELIVTFIFAEDATIENMEITSKEELTLYDNKKYDNKKLETNGIAKIENEVEKVVSYNIEEENDLYKGKLYSGEEKEYIQTDKVEINLVEAIENVKIEKQTKYKSGEEEKEANIEYVSTKIAKSEVERVLQEDGKIKIISGENTIGEIYVNTQADENGNIIVNYDEGIKEIKIEIENPKASEIIKFEHTKKIKNENENYTREEIKNINSIEEKITGKYLTEEKEITKEIELKETITKAKLEVNKTNWSTVSTNEEIQVRATLVSNKDKYDLYKNPKIEIQLPQEVEALQFVKGKIYADEFEIKSANYDKDSKKVVIELDGEQTKYQQFEAVEGPIIQLTMNISLNKNAASNISEIGLTYTNENATSYASERESAKITIEAPSGIVAYNNITSHNIIGNTVINNETQVATLNENENANIEIAATNNTGANIESATILGKFPTEGNNVGETSNTLKTVVGAITASKGTIYYSANANATKDVSNEANGWKQNIGEVENPKVFLIEIGNMNMGEIFTASYSVNIGTITASQASYTSYNFEYNMQGTSKSVTSAVVGFKTVAQIQQEEKQEEQQQEKSEEIKNDGALVLIASMNVNKEKDVEIGDILEYTIIIKNKTEKDATDIKISDQINYNCSLVSITQDGNLVEDFIINNDEDNYKVSMNLNIEANSEKIIKIKVKVDNFTSMSQIQNDIYIYKENNIISVLSASSQINQIVGNTEKNIFSNQDDKLIETKEEEIKQEETKPGEETKQEETKPGEETKQEETKPGEETKQEETKPGEERTISGIVWNDLNENGKIDEKEEKIKSVKVLLLNLKENKIQVNSKNKELTAMTDKDGKYVLKDVPNGEYIVIFEYDTENYEPTIYKAAEVKDVENSKVIERKITLEEKEYEIAGTDIIKVNDNNIENINMGLRKVKIFDLALNKYISKVIVSTSKDTRTLEFDKKNLAKVEIKGKLIQGSSVVVEYTIEVQNKGEVAGYVKNIVDYLPKSFDFSTELNKDWYKSGENIFNNSLANEKIEPGETKTVKLVLTKTLKENDTGLITNIAEISEDYNEKGLNDTNSIPNNKKQDENDMSSADLIIGIKTGGVVMYIALTISILTIIGSASYLINKKFIKLEL